MCSCPVGRLNVCLSCRYAKQRALSRAESLKSNIRVVKKQPTPVLALLLQALFSSQVSAKAKHHWAGLVDTHCCGGEQHVLLATVLSSCGDQPPCSACTLCMSAFVKSISTPCALYAEAVARLDRCAYDHFCLAWAAMVMPQHLLDVPWLQSENRQQFLCSDKSSLGRS